ncbi:hypothetical protein [Bacillus sp. UNC41MFS5]|uniref:hypothetical protein n=1 Tax=Bacillus sp. UNC41MFS5 TaxID=1449046 RepID=UPI00047DA94D|nr:hypothetical protein [Bacillus sp. UNC41MFS5]
MEDNDHRRKQNKEIDLFSRVMFGKRQSKDIDHSQESSDTRAKHNLDWLGRRRKEAVTSKKDHQTQTTQNKVENFMNNLDIELLFETYDTIKTTTEQYKPLIKGMAPFFSKITGKFKK